MPEGVVHACVSARVHETVKGMPVKKCEEGREVSYDVIDEGKTGNQASKMREGGIG